MDRIRGNEDDDLLCALQDDVYEGQAALSEEDACPERPSFPLDPGGRLSPGLYVAAVPLGNARDITLRVLDLLARADTVICEDTRMTRRLCDLHGISPRSMSVYHDHSGPADRERLISALVAGGTAVLVSDAGTPLISDPGYKLVKEAKEAGVVVRAAPGPCALAAALSVGGAPSDRFFFAGFLPSQGGARRAELETLRAIPGTLAFYESPGRLSAMLQDVAELFPGRIVSVCRELTKRYEEAWVSGAEEASRRYANPSIARGECVVLAHPYEPCEMQEAASVDARERMRTLLQTLRVKDAVNVLRSETGLPAKALYAMALECKA